MFATIYLPDFYLQAALRYQPDLRDKPVALIDDQEKKAVIIQLNAAADVLYMPNPRTTINFRFGSTYIEDDYASAWAQVPQSVWAGFWPDTKGLCGC